MANNSHCPLSITTPTPSQKSGMVNHYSKGLADSLTSLPFPKKNTSAVESMKPGEHESKIVDVQGGVAEAVEEENKKTTIASGEVKDEAETHGDAKADAKVEKPDEEEDEEDEDDDGPSPPGYRNRGPVAYNSSGSARPSKPGRPGK
ncbi:hypothetical protein L218DRAFT_1080087 [Marasmius fiardii PR-910]|nr:hypothetical protein L218DRAFT_1080087 [Marasmius fiardii PR-910]